MTDFIENDLNPWFEYANTCGPCMNEQMFPFGAQIFIEIPFLAGDYEWSGNIDGNGKACGYGIATEVSSGKELTGTFFEDQPYGFMQYDNPANNERFFFESNLQDDNKGALHGKAVYTDVSFEKTNEAYEAPDEDYICA